MRSVRTLAVIVLTGACVAGCSGGTPVSAPSPSVVPASPVASSPSAASASPSARPPVTKIPDSAFFTPPKDRTRTKPGLSSGRADLPQLCGARYKTDSRITAMRARHGLLYFAADATPETVPEGTVEQTIAAYKGGGAEAFVAEIRAAVANCPTESMAGGSKETTAFVPSFPRLGDDSFAMQQTWTDMQEYSGQLMTYLTVVRVGDVVTTLYFVGWEDYSADLTIATDYTTLATAAIQKWRA